MYIDGYIRTCMKCKPKNYNRYTHTHTNKKQLKYNTRCVHQTTKEEGEKKDIQKST